MYGPSLNDYSIDALEYVITGYTEQNYGEDDPRFTMERAVFNIYGNRIMTPEPSPLLLIGIGAGAVSLIGWRFKK
jgi:hypothetical protein